MAYESDLRAKGYPQSASGPSIFQAYQIFTIAYAVKRKRPKIVLVGFLARCAKMADGGVYAAFGSASASATVFR